MNQIPSNTNISGVYLQQQQARIAAQQMAEKQKERLFEPLDLVGTEMIKSGGVGLGKYLSGKTGIKSFEALGENVSKNGLAAGMRKTASAAIGEATKTGTQAAGDALANQLEKSKGTITKVLGDIPTSITSGSAAIQTSIQDGLADAKKTAAGLAGQAKGAAGAAVNLVSDTQKGVTNAQALLPGGKGFVVNTSSQIDQNTGKALSAEDQAAGFLTTGGKGSKLGALQAKGLAKPDFQSVKGIQAKAEAKAQTIYDSGKSNAGKALNQKKVNVTPTKTQQQNNQALYDQIKAQQAPLPTGAQTEEGLAGGQIKKPDVDDPADVSSLFNEDGTANETEIGDDLEQKAQIDEQKGLLGDGKSVSTQENNPFSYQAPTKAQFDDKNPFLFKPEPPAPPPAPPPPASVAGESEINDEMFSVFNHSPPINQGASAGYSRGGYKVPAGSQADRFNALPAPPKSTKGLVEDKSAKDDFSAPPDTKPPSQKIQAPPDTKLNEGGIPDSLMPKAGPAAPAGASATPAQPTSALKDTQTSPQGAPPGGTTSGQIEAENEQGGAQKPPTPPPASTPDKPDGGEGEGEDEGEGEGEDEEEGKAPSGEVRPEGASEEGPVIHPASTSSTLAKDAEVSTAGDENPIGDVITAALGIGSLVAGLFGGGMGDHHEQPAFPTLQQSYSAGATTAA